MLNSQVYPDKYIRKWLIWVTLKLLPLAIISNTDKDNKAPYNKSAVTVMEKMNRTDISKVRIH